MNVLDGGSGDDGLFGGVTVDILRGGSGHDDLDGRASDDQLDGGPDADHIDGGASGISPTGERHDRVIYSGRRSPDGRSSTSAPPMRPQGKAGEGDTIRDVEDVFGGDRRRHADRQRREQHDVRRRRQ